MSKISVLDYQGEKVIFDSLSESAKEQLLSLDGKPFKDVTNQKTSINLFLDKGYLPFSSPNQGMRMLKISESKKGKFIRISDTVIYLDKILGICDFCNVQEDNEVVKKRASTKQHIATFLKDFFGVKEGEKINFSGKNVQTPLGNLNVSKLEKEEIVELTEIQMYNGSFNRNEDSYYNNQMDIRFSGPHINIGCQTFITSSLTKLAKPLREYLGK